MLESEVVTRHMRALCACAKPLVFKDGKTLDPFFSGTCFRVTFRGQIYVLTAHHCIQRPDVDLQRHAVCCGEPEHRYFPLKRCHHFETASTDDTDQGDIAIFEVATERLPADEVARIKTYVIREKNTGLRTLPIGCRLFFEGYPTDLNVYDYGQKFWIRESLALFGAYAGEADANGVSIMRLDEMRGLRTLDGMSGSPVFAVARNEKSARTAFAGMVIRGGGVPPVARFITSEILVRALRSVTENLLLG